MLIYSYFKTKSLKRVLYKVSVPLKAGTLANSIHNPKEYLYLYQKRKLAVQKRLQKQVENYQFSVDDFTFSTT